MKDYIRHTPVPMVCATVAGSLRKISQSALGFSLAAMVSGETGAEGSSGFVRVGDQPIEATPFGREVRAFDLAMDADGDFVVAAIVSNRVFLRRFDSAGRFLAPEITVHRSDEGRADGVALASDARGNFVVAWIRTVDEVDGVSKIVRRRFDRQGFLQDCLAPASIECGVLPTAVGAQFDNDLVVASDADDDFLVAWRQTTDSGDPVKAVLIDRQGEVRSGQDGNAVIGLVPSPSRRRQVESFDVAMDMDGDFVVVWHDYQVDPRGEPDRESGRVFGRRFSRLGRTKGEVMRIGGRDSTDPSVAMTPRGDFVVAWDGSIAAFDDVVLIQRYEKNGQPIGNAIRVVEPGVESSPAFLIEPQISVDADGDFAVVWRLDGRTAVSGVVSDRARDDVGSIQKIAANDLGNKVRASRPAGVVMDVDGDFLVHWVEVFPSSDDLVQVRAQRYRGRERVNIRAQHDFPTTEAATATATAENRFGYSVSVSNLHMLETSDPDATIRNAIGTATDVRISACVPGGAQLPTGSGPDWNCLSSVNQECPPPSAQEVNCEYLRPLPVGGTTVPLRLEYSAPSTPQTLIHRVRVSAAQRDNIRSNNRTTQGTEVICGANPTPTPPSCEDVSAGEGPVLEFASKSPSGLNGREGEAIPLVVKLSGATPGQGVCFSLTGRGQGSAQEGQDFGFFQPPPDDGSEIDRCASDRRITSPTFTVPAAPAGGEREVTVGLLCLLDDQRIEKAEQVLLELAGSDDYQCGANNTLTVTIRDPGK